MCRKCWRPRQRSPPPKESTTALGNVKNALYSTCHALKKYLQCYLCEFCYDPRQSPWDRFYCRFTLEELISRLINTAPHIPPLP